MKKRRNIIARALLDIVAPLSRYEGEVSRVWVQGVTPEVEQARIVSMERRLIHDVGKMNRKARRAFVAAKSSGKDTEKAFRLAVAKGRIP